MVEVGDTEQLKQCISRLRNVESVFDAYRITPTGLRPQATIVSAPGSARSSTRVLLADVVAVDLDREGRGRAVLVLGDRADRRLGDVVEVLDLAVARGRLASR